MERFFVYVLYSKTLGKSYTGITTLSLEERLENHIKRKYSKTNFTQKAADWELFWFLEGKSYSQVRKIEIHIKKMKSKVYLENLKKYPEMGEKLLFRFS